MDEKLNRIKELTKLLNKASDAYYVYDNPIMTDKQYDDLYDELTALEHETGIIMANSPTQKVQGEILDGLSKVTHSRPMLSANKTKDINEVKRFIADKSAMASYKLDGLTLVTKYRNGKLVQGITRGTGYEGEDVTAQAKMISNIPLTIPCEFDLELRGECVISWENFNAINESLDTPYSHPRNLAAGSLRTLDTNITKERKLEYVVFEMVSYDNDAPYRSFTLRHDSLDYLDKLGFTTVQRNTIVVDNIDDIVTNMTAENSKYPVDGLIFNYGELSYAASLGFTSHHPLDMIALKWANETFETELLDIEWNTTRTGRINPTAIFKPVVIEGSEVSRATVHNVSIMEELSLGKGDIITVYKSNQIIPAIDENLTMSGTFTPPTTCPCCGAPTEIRCENRSKTLHCTNENCKARLISKLAHFVSRDCMNIDGLSDAKLTVFIEQGWLSNFEDIYELHTHATKMKRLDGFGKKSVEKLLDAIENSRQHADLAHFINAVGIPGCGKSISKDIATYCNNDVKQFFATIRDNADEFMKIDGVGESLIASIKKWNESEDGYMAHELAVIYLVFESPEEITNATNNTVDLSGRTYVITGSLNHFDNRDALSQLIVRLGGKVSGSVSAKVTALINNDDKSTSSKNKKALELNIPIISEEQFLESIGYQ